MTGLLISVRDGKEAAAALRGGADLIDVKEPQRGALGAADPSRWQEVQQVVAGQVPLSTALGELLEPDRADLARQTSGFQYAKLGLAGCRNDPHWTDRWKETAGQLPKTVSTVAVCYADWETAKSPPPEEILSVACEFSCSALLIDTFDKTAGNVFQHLSEERLAELLSAIQNHGMLTVLGGSLNLSCISSAMQLHPDYLAVRGAACRNTRAGRIEPDLVQLLARRIANYRKQSV